MDKVIYQVWLQSHPQSEVYNAGLFTCDDDKVSTLAKFFHDHHSVKAKPVDIKHISDGLADNRSRLIAEINKKNDELLLLKKSLTELES